MELHAYLETCNVRMVKCAYHDLKLLDEICIYTGTDIHISRELDIIPTGAHDNFSCSRFKSSAIMRRKTLVERNSESDWKEQNVKGRLKSTSDGI